MRTPTPDQQAVIGSTARIRAVRAAPGSGKTWMVAEVIRDELRRWRPGGGGIAALSFTRVGGEEIRGALGHSMAHPHFVGTIDAFLFRYVVRTHLRAIDPLAKTPDLIAAEWRPADIWTSKTVCHGINPYACVWTGRDENGKPALSRANRYGGVTSLTPDEKAAVLQFKSELRRKHGRITLSDSALFASLILTHTTHGAVVRAEIVRRFPLIIIDELQDTGVFLAESVKALLKEPASRGLLVGDPDQAIYEFNGANAQTFDTFLTIPGAGLLELATTQRCPPRAAHVASHLKRSGGALNPAPGREGRALLVRYEDMVRDVVATVHALRRANPADIIKVVARSNSTVEQLTGRSGIEVPSLGCRPAALVHRAVRHFRRGKSVTALAAAKTALELIMLDGEGLTDDELRNRGVDPAALKDVTIRCLLAANALSTDGTAITWQTQALGLLSSHAAVLCVSAGLPLPNVTTKPRKNDGHDAPVARSIPSDAAVGMGGVPVLTVHGVKGETHDVTIVVAPPTSGQGGSKRCPSVLWWPAGSVDDEERRVAYVALTRTRRDLIVYVDGPAFARLASTQPAFVSGFESLSSHELLQRLGDSAVVS